MCYTDIDVDKGEFPYQPCEYKSSYPFNGIRYTNGKSFKVKIV